MGKHTHKSQVLDYILRSELFPSTTDANKGNILSMKNKIGSFYSTNLFTKNAVEQMQCLGLRGYKNFDNEIELTAGHINPIFQDTKTTSKFDQKRNQVSDTCSLDSGFISPANSFRIKKGINLRHCLFTYRSSFQVTNEPWQQPKTINCFQNYWADVIK